MVPRCVPAVAVATLFSCALPAQAAAERRPLVAEIAQAKAQATPTPPPLTEEPDGLDGEATPEPTAEPVPTADPEPSPEATPGSPQLPDTGAEPAFLALAGLGLLAAGAGLRRTVDEILPA